MDSKKREGRNQTRRKIQENRKKLYEFSEKTGPEECRNSFNVKRIMRYLFILNTLQLTT